ncbi:ADP-ribosyltransferase exoenzyme [uncultured virus]|nr:ADP-ribosyltransferase exoenzyme [uncultured virus]
MAYILYFFEEKVLKISPKTNVLDFLYYQKARVPLESDIIEYLESDKVDKKIENFFKGNNYKISIKKIKKSISKIDLKIPLYDEYTKNLYLINRNKVYEKVFYQYYRFPNKELIKLFKKRKAKLEILVEETNIKEQNLGEFEKTQTVHYDLKKIIEQREFRKLELMINFLDQFDLETLQNTYIKVFYFYANEVGKNITVCIRPSFLPNFKHIKPFYSRTELINLSLNMGIIKPSLVYFDEERVMNLCLLVKKNDINAETLLKHQDYIARSNSIGLVQFYSMQGSFFMNQYLREISSDYKNPLLEYNIELIWKLINKAPAFDKSYSLYRFIKKDSYLKHLKIGDIFVDPSFISTTRDPFYRSDVYKFGFILIRIKLPENVIGVGLCIESYSNFPEEQEIILPPLSILRLDNKDESVPYYHTDDNYATNIKTRYEFTLIGKQDISFPKKSVFIENQLPIDFLVINKIETLTINERITYFIKNYVNKIYQFDSIIGNEKFTLIVEWYDSTEVYKNFYAEKTNNGFMIYTLLNGYIGFNIELGEDQFNTYMYVNYYHKYSTIPNENKISDKDFIEFLSKLGYYFEIKKIVIYGKYISCDFLERTGNYFGGNYCKDIYDYLKNGIKRFSKFDSIEIKPKFSYYELDRIKEVSPSIILSEDDRDEIYQIYKKIFKLEYPKDEQNLSKFYVWLIDNYCLFVENLVKKMSRFYNMENPFENDFYILDSVIYLYNKGLINDVPTFMESTEGKEIINKVLPKNEYRINREFENRLPKNTENFKDEIEIK